jgi:hypothetical protein
VIVLLDLNRSVTHPDMAEAGTGLLDSRRSVYPGSTHGQRGPRRAASSRRGFRREPPGFGTAPQLIRCRTARVSGALGQPESLCEL